MAQEFPCGKCGAKLKFTPGVQALKCSYCGHENPIPQSEDDIEELDFRAQLDGLERGEAQIEQTTVKCGSCAAESTLDPNVTSTECPFCGTPLVAQSESKRLVKPKSLLPFKVTRDEGREQFQQWVRSRWFAPGKFKKRRASMPADAAEMTKIPYVGAIVFGTAAALALRWLYEAPR